MVRIIRTRRELSLFLSELRNRSDGAGFTVTKTVEEILEDIRTNGDKALRKYTALFDRISPRSLRIPEGKIKSISKKTPPDVKRALRKSALRIREFHKRQMEKSWRYTKDGITLGQIIRPLRRVGVYVPGGKAAYPSTVLMNVIPAQVAGVEEIAVTVPTPGGEINPAVMTALDILGVKEVYSVGGAQAIGALAYGTKTIRAVDKIVGPGNIYVATAKRLVFGTVDIDMIAGPSEVLIIADSSGDPKLIGADLLSQAEHDELASSILITTSTGLAKRVQKEVERQLNKLKRREIALNSLKNYGRIIIVKNLKEAVDIANIIAPEHLEVMTKRPESLLNSIRNAGAIFLGHWTPEPLGDYSAGPNHTLPTGGTARFFSPLGVYDFLKRSSLLSFTERGFRKIADIVELLADTEGLEAHANTIRVRKNKSTS
ncbi:MAG: histidinol dehydrogenase [Nitrospirae bacterium]|nr:MAG: histidinol dehydrogenase [Nitrospirota bacterium]